MQALILHVDLIGSRSVLSDLSNPNDRRMLSVLLEGMLRLLVARFTAKAKAEVAFSGDGGFCIVPFDSAHTDYVGVDIRSLFHIARAYPEYVNILAQQPFLSGPVKSKLRFRRGISFVDDVPAGPELRAQNVMSLRLANALKFERDWIKGDGKDNVGNKIVIWESVKTLAPEIQELQGINRRVFEFPNGERIGMYDFIDARPRTPTPPVSESPEGTKDYFDSTMGLDVLPHMIALEYALIHDLRACQNKRMSLSAALLDVFEPIQYLKDTLTAMKAFVSQDLLSGHAVRAAIFVPDRSGPRTLLKLVASAAYEKHTAKALPLNKVSAAAVAFKTGEPVVVPIIRKASSVFCYTSKEQRRYLQSIICIPILPTITKKEGHDLPSRVEWGKPIGVLSIDSAKAGIFSQFASDNGRSLAQVCEAFIRDLELGIIIGSF